MSLDLMDMVKRLIKDSLGGQLGGLLGEGEDATGKAIDVGIPAILGGLLKKTADPAGARELSEELDRQDDSFLDDLSGAFERDSSAFEATGGGLLEQILGEQSGGIAEWLGNFAGIRKASAGKLLSLLAPIVMGFLSRQKKSLGLDADGFAKLLDSQKGSLSKALPTELAGTMGIANLLATESEAAPRPMLDHHPDQNLKGGGIMKILLPLALTAALIYFSSIAFDGGKPPAEEMGDDGLEVPAVELPSVEIPGVEIPGEDSSSE